MERVHSAVSGFSDGGRGWGTGSGVRLRWGLWQLLRLLLRQGLEQNKTLGEEGGCVRTARQ